MKYLGYEFVKQHLKLKAFQLAKPACIGSVTRITPTTDTLLVPASVAPQQADVIEHLRFSLKHEGVNLQVLAQALRHVPEAVMRATVQATPSGRYVRLLGFLWETFNNREIADLPTIAGPIVDLFDHRRYFTTSGTRNTRWRINFNGLGSVHYLSLIHI